MVADNKALVHSTVGKSIFTYGEDNFAVVRDIEDREESYSYLSSPLKLRQRQVSLRNHYANTQLFLGSGGIILKEARSIVERTQHRFSFIMEDKLSSLYVSNNDRDDLQLMKFMYGAVAVVTDRSHSSALTIISGSSINKNSNVIPSDKDTIVVAYNLEKWSISEKKEGSGTAVIYDRVIKEKSFPYNLSETYVSREKRPLLFYNEAFINVMDKENQSGLGTTPIKPVSIVVENYRPPSFDNVGSGTSMRDMRIVAQKQSFIELILNFEEASVIDVQGLPEGLLFDENYKMIKGSPSISGNYAITMELDNGFNIEGIIVVPDLPRNL